jgi:hypothetical protein
LFQIFFIVDAAFPHALLLEFDPFLGVVAVNIDAGNARRAKYIKLYISVVDIVGVFSRIGIRRQKADLQTLIGQSQLTAG